MGKPLLFMFWTAVLWGTFLFFALLFQIFDDGAADALRALVPGRGDVFGWMNLVAIPLALLVWAVAGFVAVRVRRGLSLPP